MQQLRLVQAKASNSYKILVPIKLSLANVFNLALEVLSAGVAADPDLSFILLPSKLVELW